MADIQEIRYAGQACVQLKNENLSLWITTDLGPRILGLELRGGENLMAVLPDAKIPVENRADYSLRGGHRLWYAPEDPLTTYLPDDLPVEIKIQGESLEIIQPADQPTGIQKSWEIRLDGKDPRVVIDHRLTNLGEEGIRLAPWAITMLRPGGKAVLPLQTDLDDPHGLWPNRQLVVWPYTQLKSPYLELTDQALFVRAEMDAGALKVGAPNPGGWIAYSWKGTLFVKENSYQPGKTYLDRGASSQIYCSPDMIELETQGPAVQLGSGETVGHEERWSIYSEGEWPANIQDLLLSSES